MFISLLDVYFHFNSTSFSRQKLLQATNCYEMNLFTDVHACDRIISESFHFFFFFLLYDVYSRCPFSPKRINHLRASSSLSTITTKQFI